MLKISTLGIFILLLFGSLAGQELAGQERDRKATVKTITGTVVAYHNFSPLLPCYHICGGSLIVRLEKSGAPSDYIRVDFTYPDRKFPTELVKSKKMFRLRLTRTTERDAPFLEFVKAVNEKTGEEMTPQLRAWTLLPGAEGEKLPYGAVLPSYSLVEDIFDLIGRK